MNKSKKSSSLPHKSTRLTTKKRKRSVKPELYSDTITNTIDGENIYPEDQNKKKPFRWVAGGVASAALLYQTWKLYQQYKLAMGLYDEFRQRQGVPYPIWAGMDDNASLGSANMLEAWLATPPDSPSFPNSPEAGLYPSGSGDGLLSPPGPGFVENSPLFDGMTPPRMDPPLSFPPPFDNPYPDVFFPNDINTPYHPSVIAPWANDTPPVFNLPPLPTGPYPRVSGWKQFGMS